ncbi:MAG: hypothetical protein CL484_03095 [Acidobacteria bacterium]|nr:hypothetical protein [Acidobacteriota bacterium]
MITDEFNQYQLRWLEILETTDAAQGMGRLWQQYEEGIASYCCLGLAELEFDENSAGMQPQGKTLNFPNRSAGVVAGPRTQELLHLYTGEGSFYLSVFSSGNSLAGLNDSGWTFAQIAKAIRTYPGLVFRNFTLEVPSKEDMHKLLS